MITSSDHQREARIQAWNARRQHPHATGRRHGEHQARLVQYYAAQMARHFLRMVAGGAEDIRSYFAARGEEEVRRQQASAHQERRVHKWRRKAATLHRENRRLRGLLGWHEGRAS